MRMVIVLFFNCFNDFFGVVRQVVCSNYVQVRGVDDFFVFFDVGVFQVYDQRNFQVDFFDSCYNVFCDYVIVYDVVEDVYKDVFDVWIRCDDFECFSYFFFGCIVVDVEEVGWFCIVKFDDVYSGYC